jgi:hypothetical protein
MQNEYAMFSDQGNEQVHLIVVEIQRSGLKDNEAWRLTCKALESLSKDKGFGEAMDTDVRDHVYCKLQHLKVIDQYETHFYI